MDKSSSTPCIGLCTATALGDDICRGCNRTAKEVIEWNQYSDEKKIEINRRLECQSSMACITVKKK